MGLWCFNYQCTQQVRGIRYHQKYEFQFCMISRMGHILLGPKLKFTNTTLMSHLYSYVAATTA